MNLSALSGMQSAARLFDDAADRTAKLSVAGPDAAGGEDLPAQVAKMITATIVYQANARVMEAGAETERSLFDAVA